MRWFRWLVIQSSAASAGRRLTGIFRKRPARLTLVLLVTLYAGLLRLDALTGRYGTLDHPAWARVATQQIAPVAARLRPSSVRWTREPRPYVGGDPINYLASAREMQSFYQPHVREPVFLAVTRAALWAVDDQDVAVSFASAAGSTLAVPATYLLGAELVSPVTGLLAAAVMAIDYQAVFWAPEGWRDDTFTALVGLAAWALLRLRNRAGFWTALLAGGLCGVACLVRVTAISFIAPVLILLVVDRAPTRRLERLRHAATAALILAIVVAPYLISCAIATGDPLYAINYHTGYYRHAAGESDAGSMSAFEYLRTRFERRPVAMFDTGLVGLFVRPITTMWGGFDAWTSGLGQVLRWLSVAGLAVVPFLAPGRLVLLLLLTSLLPYCFTWNLGGGGEWRFYMHAGPAMAVAAASALVWGARRLAALVRDPSILRRIAWGAVAWRAGGIALVSSLLGAAYVGMPWLVVREAVVNGESVSLETGPRDAIFYRSGWSPPHTEGVTVRVSLGRQSAVHIPLSGERDYDIVIRLDPVAPTRQEYVHVLLNGILAGSFRLALDPERVGAYRIRADRRLVSTGANVLTIVPDTTVAAGSVGSRFSWIAPTRQVGVRLWYVRVLPSS